MIIFWPIASSSGGSPTDNVDPGVANVKLGVDYKINGVTKTGTMTNISPGVENVLAGVTFTINGVQYTGTANQPPTLQPGIIASFLE